jgi:2-polyprenyl-3-methyl-5-hydroxy-6-metoxy-1,4-benzoquinol methylase
MLKLARARSKKEALSTGRIRFIEATIPSNNIPQKPYELIISNSLLHHLHDPLNLWKTALQHSTPKTVLFIADLCRPEDSKSAQQIVNEFAAGEPELLRRDFYNSLLAAFSPAEIKNQLKESGLGHLSINQKDHHLFIYGKPT